MYCPRGGMAYCEFRIQTCCEPEGLDEVTGNWIHNFYERL